MFLCNSLKSLKLHPRVEKYYEEAGINSDWLRGFMDNLDPKQQANNLNYSYFQQCVENKSEIRNPAAYLTATLKKYESRLIPKPLNFKSEEQLDLEEKMRQKAAKRFINEEKREIIRQNSLLEERDRINKKYLDKFKEITKDLYSDQVKELILKQPNSIQQRINTKIKESKEIAFLHRNFLYKAFLKAQKVDKKLIEEVSSVEHWFNENPYEQSGLEPHKSQGGDRCSYDNDTSQSNKAISANKSTEWSKIENSIKSKVPEHSYKMWFKPLKSAEINQEGITLSCPNGFFKRHLISKYSGVIKQTAHEIFGTHLALHFDIVK